MHCVIVNMKMRLRLISVLNIKICITQNIFGIRLNVLKCVNSINVVTGESDIVYLWTQHFVSIYNLLNDNISKEKFYTLTDVAQKPSSPYFS